MFVLFRGSLFTLSEYLRPLLMKRFGLYIGRSMFSILRRFNCLVYSCMSDFGTKRVFWPVWKNPQNISLKTEWTELPTSICKSQCQRVSFLSLTLCNCDSIIQQLLTLRLCILMQICNIYERGRCFKVYPSCEWLCFRRKSPQVCLAIHFY